ncbi:MAG: hypothetical protein IJT28_06985 [Bacteroidaceae bacterium]|nr:hypothetical protein [Bacteroidaceae bacterium]
MKRKLIVLLPLLFVFVAGMAQTTPKSQLIYCSCAETPYGIPDKGKDYYELIADVGKTPKVVKCTDAGTGLETKKEYAVSADDVKRMQQLLQDLDVGKLNGYNQDDGMTGGHSYRVYMEYADGQKINATWYTHDPNELAVTTYNTILRNLSAFFTQGSQSKDGQIKRIREVYADAKKMVAANGEEGKAPHDMTITLNDGTQVDEDFIINEETELKFFFKKKNEPTSYLIDPTSICYFATEEFSAHGHLMNREWLFDPEKGHLLFVYTRTETDAGHVIEYRYYYDEQGKLIEQKKKEGGKDVKEDDLEPYDGGMELTLAKTYLDVFETMVNPNDIKQVTSKLQTTSKANRLKMIKSTYANAKDKVSKNNKSELPRDMRIVIHDQLAEDYPPVTDDVKFYFEPDPKDDGYRNHCYFIVDQHSSMYFKEYSEFLLDPTYDKLVFSYTQTMEEGETYEWRYYFDENGKCIDRKVKTPDDDDEGDSGVDDKEQFGKYLKVFNLIANSSM